MEARHTYAPSFPIRAPTLVLAEDSAPLLPPTSLLVEHWWWSSSNPLPFLLEKYLARTLLDDG